MQKALQKILTASLLLCCFTLAAQESGNWRAVSNTARSITGDVALADEKISINFTVFPIARIRGLEKPEISAVFNLESIADASGSLYRLNIPASKKFLHHNSLCGAKRRNINGPFSSEGQRLPSAPRFTLFNTLPPSHSAVEESNVLLRTITSDGALGGLESCSQILHSSKRNRTYRLPRARRKPPP